MSLFGLAFLSYFFKLSCGNGFCYYSKNYLLLLVSNKFVVLFQTQKRIIISLIILFFNYFVFYFQSKKISCTFNYFIFYFSFFFFFLCFSRLELFFLIYFEKNYLKKYKSLYYTS